MLVWLSRSGGFFEGSPVEFDRFGGLKFIRESFREGAQRRFVARVDSDGLPQCVNSGLWLADFKRQVGEELIGFRIARRGFDDIAAGFQCGIELAETDFEIERFSGDTPRCRADPARQLLHRIGSIAKSPRAFVQSRQELSSRESIAVPVRRLSWPKPWRR